MTRRLVLLSLGAFWCRGCDLMDLNTYRDPRIVQLVTSDFVPIKVDADWRPDINARYNLDGWPTTAVLTPTGEIMTGSTYLPPEALAAMLEESSVAFRDQYDELCARAAEVAAERRASLKPVRYEPDGGAPAWLLSRAIDEHDSVHGGFGTAGKFLHADVLRFTLAMYRRTRDERVGGVLVRSLDAICRGGHYDAVDGGFFRYAAGRDFTRPHTEKLIEDQIGVIDVLLGAADTLDRVEYRERAIDTIRYVQRTLSDRVRGGFFASQKPDDDYYVLNGSLRQSLEAPRVDTTLFVDLNARAIVTWLEAAMLLADPELARFAVETADRALLETYDEHAGHSHAVDGDSARNLLGDQVYSADAWLRLFEVTRRSADLDRAVSVMRSAVRRFWDPSGGGFFDRAHGGPDEIGRLADRMKPVVLNSEAARVLSRLASITGESEWRVRSRQALGAVTGTYRGHGLGAAAYALAALEVLELGTPN